MSELEQKVQAALESHGFTYIPCGLNADWSVSAWHLGPSSTPNRTDHDLYLLDTEEQDDTFEVVTREYVDGGNDTIHTIERGSLMKVLRAARKWL